MKNYTLIASPWQLASFFALSLTWACGSSSPSEPVVEAESEGELTETPCESSIECNDGVFCNGTEICDEGFCRLGVSPRCDDGIKCTRDICSHATSSCQFIPPDEDGDGHADASCTGPDGEALGDDCDDDDANRYPGNTEICGKENPGHDEDCDPKTFGYQDDDADGEVADSCCNEDADGELNCGPDCDDDDYRRNHNYPEICDDIDNDCDGKVDKNTKEVLWYPDDDGDHFGVESDDAILSCAPVENRSLRASDCNDTESAVHIAAREECDGVDNDCDGEVDEGGVCACAPQGNVRPCSCGGSLTGVQQCDGGLWNSCDCKECVTGSVDCVGELLPRECVAGRWEVQPSCRGIRPICLEGSCMCADGSDSCAPLTDVLRPYVKDSFPLENSANTPGGAHLAVEFNEDIAQASAAGAFELTDSFGAVLPGTLSVGARSLYFVPTMPLGAGQAYQFHVKSTITDLAGNALLPHTPVDFRTTSGLTPVRVFEDQQRRLSDPVLAVNEAGQAVLLGTSGPTPGFPGAPPHTSYSVWTETKFAQGNILSTETGQISAAFDGLNNFLFGQQPDAEHLLHYFNDGDFSVTESLATDVSFDSTPVFASSAGSAVALWTDAGQLQVASGTTTSALDAPYALPNSTGPLKEVAGDINPAGRGLVAFNNGSATYAFLSDLNLGNWQDASISGGPNPPLTAISNIQVVLGTDDIATFAWVHFVTGTPDSASQVFTQKLGGDGQWIGSPIQPRGSFNAANERAPHLVSDAADNQILSYVRGTEIVAVHRSTTGSWSAETFFNPPSDLEVHSSSLKIAESGEAVLAFVSTSSQNTTDLWLARYSPGSGWTPARLVEDGTAKVTSFDVGIDGAGNVLVVYTTNSADAVWVRL